MRPPRSTRTYTLFPVTTHFPSNSTAAREYEIALPAELSTEARRELALGLAREISERHGVAVDLAIHAPGREGDHRNHHAHLLTTPRRIGPEGLGAKTRELDQKTSGEVERWRGRWAEMQNAELERANVPERVDHRSHQRRGIEQEADRKSTSMNSSHKCATRM